MKRLTSLLLICLLFFGLICSSVQAAVLSDLNGHWSAGDVNRLIARGAIGGYPDGTFRPDKSISRAEFSKILRQSLGLATMNGTAFRDTDAHWASTDIETLIANEIIVPSEYGTNYGPDGAITRREIAIMLIRAMGLNRDAVALSGQPTGFQDDAKLASYDKGYLYLARELGLIGGYEDGSFRPNNKATRAEASVMIVRLLDSLGLTDSDSMIPTTPSTPADPVNPAPQTPAEPDSPYQLKVTNATRSAVNSIGEQYLVADLELIVKNTTGKSITVSDQNFKTTAFYDKGAQVVATQSAFSETIAAGKSDTIRSTVSILLPNNSIANLVLGSQITDIQITLNIDGASHTFTDCNTTLLQNAK